MRASTYKLSWRSAIGAWMVRRGLYWLGRELLLSELWRLTRGLTVVGIDEWAWRKGRNFGTVIVDLERRKVVELLAVRTATSTAEWFKRHPGVEIVGRDRAGLYAEAARQGAPQARQVADRFHLLKNFRETVERQLGRFEAPIRQGAHQIEDDLDPPEQPVIER